MQQQRRRPFRWSDEQTWPFDPPGYVFLARAAKPFQEIRPGLSHHAIKLEMREHLAYGRLRSALLFEDGTLVAMPAHAWNTDDFEDWFETGKATYCPEDAHPLYTPPKLWLYIEVGGLNTLLAPTVDRTPKKRYPVSAVVKWRENLFGEVANGDRPKPDQMEIERLARIEFRDISTVQVRKDVWDKRPWRKGRASPGA